MTNAQDNTKNTAKTPSAPMGAWDMACSCLVGLHKSVAQARAEYDAALTASNNNPLGVGVASAARVINVIGEATRLLEQDIRQHARSSGLAMPELKGIRS